MKTIKKILAPTDFSDRATRALKYAISLAHATEAKLFILHAYRMPSGATGTPYPMTGLYVDVVANQELIEKEVQQSFDEIEDIKNRIMTENEITITKRTELMNKEKTQVFCEVKKIIYVADKSFYKNKRAKSKSKT